MDIIKVKKFSIGIDPGSKTGLAVYNRDKKEITGLFQLDFWSAYDFLCASDVYNSANVFAVVVEVPRSKFNWHGAGAAVDVGGVCREAFLLSEGLKKSGFNVIKQHPAGKIDHPTFCRRTGWQGGVRTTNEHKRDAGMLCFGL